MKVSESTKQWMELDFSPAEVSLIFQTWEDMRQRRRPVDPIIKREFKGTFDGKQIHIS